VGRQLNRNVRIGCRRDDHPTDYPLFRAVANHAFRAYGVGAERGKVKSGVMKRFLTLLLGVLSTSMALGMTDQSNIAALKQRALAGDPAAQVKVGMSYALAYPRDAKEAIKWFQMAADQGYADGEYRLAGMFDVGISPPNLPDAVKWYTAAAKQGYKDAEYRLAVLYDQGRGVDKNYVEAAKWYIKAADQGRPEAQYRLGQMYEHGQGVTQSYTEAMKRYMQAAMQNRPEAEFKVGSFYEQGQGVAKNRTEAIAWYTKADKQGFPDAHEALQNLEQQ
jgi:uncharacterized protein